MENIRNILPEMVSVSRNCRLTNELYQILIEKLSDEDLATLHRWLQIVEEEQLSYFGRRF